MFLHPPPSLLGGTGGMFFTSSSQLHSSLGPTSPMATPFNKWLVFLTCLSALKVTCCEKIQPMIRTLSPTSRLETNLLPLPVLSKMNCIHFYLCQRHPDRQLSSAFVLQADLERNILCRYVAFLWNRQGAHDWSRFTAQSSGHHFTFLFHWVLKMSQKRFAGASLTFEKRGGGAEVSKCQTIFFFQTIEETHQSRFWNISWSGPKFRLWSKT